MYLVCNQYPASITFSLSFSGKSFATQTVYIGSEYSNQSETVALGQLSATAGHNGKSIPSASVIIYSDNLNASLTTSTSSTGNVVVSAPPGYTIRSPCSVWRGCDFAEINLAGQKKQTYVVVFLTQTNYTMELIWIVRIIVVLGAMGNLWFWIIRKRQRTFPAQN